MRGGYLFVLFVFGFVVLSCCDLWSFSCHPLYNSLKLKVLLLVTSNIIMLIILCALWLIIIVTRICSNRPWKRTSGERRRQRGRTLSTLAKGWGRRTLYYVHVLYVRSEPKAREPKKRIPANLLCVPCSFNDAVRCRHWLDYALEVNEYVVATGRRQGDAFAW